MNTYSNCSSLKTARHLAVFVFIKGVGATVDVLANDANHIQPPHHISLAKQLAQLLCNIHIQRLQLQPSSHHCPLWIKLLANQRYEVLI